MSLAHDKFTIVRSLYDDAVLCVRVRIVLVEVLVLLDEHLLNAIVGERLPGDLFVVLLFYKLDLRVLRWW